MLPEHCLSTTSPGLLTSWFPSKLILLLNFDVGMILYFSYLYLMLYEVPDFFDDGFNRKSTKRVHAPISYTKLVKQIQIKLPIPNINYTA